jgi:hypothetical protein
MDILPIWQFPASIGIAYPAWGIVGLDHVGWLRRVGPSEAAVPELFGGYLACVSRPKIRKKFKLLNSFEYPWFLADFAKPSSRQPLAFKPAMRFSSDEIFKRAQTIRKRGPKAFHVLQISPSSGIASPGRRMDRRHF